MHTIPVISLDGVSAAGKGTLGLLLSRCLHWNYLDSGSFYRLLALQAIQHDVSLDNPKALVALVDFVQPVFKIRDKAQLSLEIFSNRKNVTELLRSETLGLKASILSTHPEVRSALLQAQRNLKVPPGLIADGRDMGSVVFPDSVYKFFLTASAGIRAKRRYSQLKQQGICVSFDEVKTAILKRDYNDQTRSVAALKATQDMYIIDTSDLSVSQVLSLMRKKLSEIGIRFQQ